MLTLDVAQRRLTEDAKMVRLTQRETDLLACLFRQYPDRVDHQVLIAEVWKHVREPETANNTLKVHVGRLRKSLNDIGFEGLIRNHHGLGYCVTRAGLVVGDGPMIARDTLAEINRLLTTHPDPRAAALIARLPVVSSTRSSRDGA